MPIYNKPTTLTPSVAVIGKTGGRVITGQIDGTDASGGAVTTALANFASTAIPLAHLFMAQGVGLDTANTITIKEPGFYRVSGKIRFAGGTSAARVVRLLVNGSPIDEPAFTITAGVIVASREIQLYAGDLVTLAAYVETGSVTAAARALQFFDVNLTVTRSQLAPITPILSGWSGVASAVSAAPYGLATRDITNTWLSRSTWTDLNGSALAGQSDTQYWKNNFRSRAITVGCPLIPWAGNAASTWNSLLDEVIAGTRDSTFTTLGTNLALNSPDTVICRLWWEMNKEYNDNPGMIDPVKFANAWNRVAPIIRTAFNAAARPGQTLKFSYSYLIYLTAGSTYNEMTLYPGNTYVDVIAPDLYAQLYQTTNPTVTTVLNAIKPRLQELSVYAAQKGKPVALDEWGTHIIEPVDGIAKVRGIGDAPGFADMVFDWAEQNQAQYMSLYSIADGAGFVEVYNYPNFLARFVERGNAVATFATKR